jgi:putative redox protein
MALSLAGCTGMDVISILRKKRQDITVFTVEVEYQRAEEHPRVMTGAEIHYRVAGNEVSEKALLRAIELSAVRYCPAQAMLSGILPIQLSYAIYEGDDLGEESLVTEGEYRIPSTNPG